MKFCYVDESGCTGMLPSATSEVQPLLVILGLIVDEHALHEFTLKFLYLKRTFFPNSQLRNGRRPDNFLDWILPEIKGADVRRQASETSKRQRRFATRFLSELLTLVEQFGCKIVGRVWVKGIGSHFDGNAVYTSSIQRLCTYFQSYLSHSMESGLLIADSRNQAANTGVSHSVFTQRFQSRGNPFVSLAELPVFGHSNNHAGLQVCDLLCSGIVFPLAVNAYCAGKVQSFHVRPGYAGMVQEHGERLKQMQYRYLDSDGRYAGGIVVSDSIAGLSGKLLFQSPVVV